MQELHGEQALQEPLAPVPTTLRRGAKLSKDGQWYSFPKVPNLIQYKSTGKYYARVRIRGKLLRQCLETDVWTTAKLRLMDYAQAQRALGTSTEVVTLGEAVKSFE